LFLAVAWLGCGTQVVTDGVAPSPTTEPESPGEPEPQGDTICPSAGWASADEPVMTLTHADGFRLVRAGGAIDEIDFGGPAAPAGAIVDRVANSEAGYVSLVRNLVLADGGIAAQGRLLLLGRDGTPLWDYDDADHELRVLGISAEGSVTVSRYGYEKGSDDALIHAGGAVQPLAGYTITGAQRADGLVPVRHMETNIAGFVDPETNEFEPISVGEPLWTLPHEGGFMSLSAGKSAPWLVIDQPGEVRTVVLWDLGVDDPGQLLRRHRNGRWVLLEDTVEHRLWRVDLETEQVALVPAVPPGGWLFEDNCGSTVAAVDADGRVLRASRDDATATIQAVDIDPQSWTPLGRAMTELRQIRASVHGRSYLLAADSSAGFCAPLEWSSAPEGALAGPSLQVTRPDSGASHVLPIAVHSLALNADGTCVAYQDGRQRAHVLDVIAGSDVTLEQSGVASWIE
jgi:hypothetical protein